MLKSSTAIAAALFAFALGASSASAEQAGVKIGILECNVAGGTGFIFGSSKEIACAYSPNKGPADYYRGEINKYGIDIGYTEKSKIIWAVFAPTGDIRQGALSGNYGGASAQATIAVGLGANVLIGGFDESIALQPLSVEGTEGLNVALAVSELKLEATTKAPE